MPTTRRRRTRTTTPTTTIGQHDHYASLAAYVERALSATDYREHEPTDFNGYTSFDEACRMAANGWDAVAAEVQAAVSYAGDVPELAPVWDVAGDEVDIPRYLDGIPENMVSYPYQPARRPVVTVYVPVSFSWQNDAEQVKRFGLAVVGGIEALRLSGHTVRVVGILTSGGDTDSTPVRIDTIDLADTRYAYDATQLMFAIAHPSMFRQVGFRVVDTWDDGHRYGARSYYTTPRDPSDIPAVREYLESRPGHDPDTSVWFPMLKPNWTNSLTDESARQKVTDLLAG